MSFHLFDRTAETVVRYGVLPHWFQQGVTYFVTFRTADSVPQKLANAWYGRRDAWLIQHGLYTQSGDWQQRLREAPDLDREFHRRFTGEFMAYLDRGHGECPLSDPSISAIVAATLLHFDGVHYELGDFVVMPNHVHLLACLQGTTQIQAQCRSWKRYSARKINEHLGRTGRFWQSESFDHLVRSPEQFAYLQRYIADNPTKAGLKAGSYRLRVGLK